MRSQAALLLLAALAAPVTADTVYLANGNKFEEVVAERVGDGLRIRLPYGEIVLPDRVVARVEPARSAWQEYGERAAALRLAPSTARQWLELARWADERGHRPGMREALLRAAELDPGLEGLVTLMPRIGHIFDEDTGRWLSEEEYMRRRGYRLWGGHWLPGEEYAARRRAHEEAEKRRRQEAREERLARALEALVVAQLSRAAEAEPEPEPAEGRAPLVAVYSGVFSPFYGSAVGVPQAVTAPDQATWEDVAKRQPGSLFPLRPRRHLSSSD